MNGDPSGGNPMAGRVWMALIGGSVLGLALIGLTENVFAVGVGLGLSLLVIASLRP